MRLIFKTADNIKKLFDLIARDRDRIEGDRRGLALLFGIGTTALTSWEPSRLCVWRYTLASAFPEF
jgi:hypothetical protein